MLLYGILLPSYQWYFCIINSLLQYNELYLRLTYLYYLGKKESLLHYLQCKNSYTYLLVTFDLKKQKFLQKQCRTEVV